MTPARLSVALGAMLLLGACEARIGKSKEEPAGTAEATKGAPAGKAEEGQLSIDAPGFAMKLAIPAGLAERATVESDDGLLYPGAVLSGMHVQARDDGHGNSMVELRFISSEATPRLAEWYRDPARAPEFAVTRAGEQGGIFTIAGTETGDGDPFELRLSPRPGGGTDGILRLRDRG